MKTVLSRAYVLYRAIPMVVSIALLSCAAPYNTNFSKLQPGQTRSQVDQLLGKPISAEGAGNTQILYYRLASSVLDSDGSDTREYYVVLNNNRVTQYGERNDAVTKLRSERQYESAWQLTRSLQQGVRNQQDANFRQQEIDAYNRRTLTPQNVNVDATVTHR